MPSSQRRIGKDTNHSASARISALILLSVLVVLLPQSIINAHAKLLWLPGTSFSSSLASTGANNLPVAPWPKRSGHASATFNGKVWVMGGQGDKMYNDVWSSDGSTWVQSGTTSPWTARQRFTLTPFNNELYLIGGTASRSPSNEVWRFDGASTWTKVGSAGFGARHSHCAVMYNNMLYVMMGINGTGPTATIFDDVWTGTGGSWLQFPKSDGAAWPTARWGMSCIVYDNKIYMVGGETATSYSQEVWSFNGLTWHRELVAGFSGRSFESLIVVGSGSPPNSKLVLMGGKGEVKANNEVWVYDESTWSQLMTPPWGAREQATAALAPFKIGQATAGKTALFMGGLDGTQFNNEVWFLQDISVPSAPQAVTAVVPQADSISDPSNAVELSWTAPADDGGSPITVYVITNSWDKKRFNVTSAVVSTTLTDMTYPANYTFFVTAVNMAGTGAISAPSNQVHTVAAGIAVNGGSLTTATDEDQPVQASTWFIVLMVLVTVIPFVGVCLCLIRRRLREADEELLRLDELDSLAAAQTDEADAGAGSRHALDMVGTAIQPSHEMEAADMAQQKYEREQAWRVAGASLRHHEPPRMHEHEYERGYDYDYDYDRAHDRPAHEHRARALAPQHPYEKPHKSVPYAPADEDEEEAMMRLGADGDRYQDPNRIERITRRDREREREHERDREREHERKREPELGEEPELEVEKDPLVARAAASICESLTNEYSRRQEAAQQHGTHVSNMLPYDHVFTLVEGAFESTGCLRYLPSPSSNPAMQQRKRSELQRKVYQVLVDEVSYEAAERARKKARNSGMEPESTSQRISRIARTVMQHWAMEQSKSRKEVGHGVVVGVDGELGLVDGPDVDSHPIPRGRRQSGIHSSTSQHRPVSHQSAQSRSNKHMLPGRHSSSGTSRIAPTVRAHHREELEAEAAQRSASSTKGPYAYQKGY